MVLRPGRLLFDSKPAGHFFVEESLARTVRLHPFPVDHKLRDGAFARALQDLVGGAGSAFDIDFFVRNVVFGQKALGFAAIRTPAGRVNGQLHKGILQLQPSPAEDEAPDFESVTNIGKMNNA